MSVLATWSGPRSVPLLVAILALGACTPKVNLEVLRPADIPVPAHIRTLAVIDRAEPANVGEGILSVIEGALTGEGIMADRHAAGEAVRGLYEQVGSSPRFKVVQPSIDKKTAESDIFDKELSWKAAKRIAKDAGADAIVALEAFDSDSNVATQREVVEETVDGKTVRRNEWTASRDTQVLSAWRIYDVKNEVVVDDLRDHNWTSSWNGSGSTEGQAISALPSVYDSVQVVGYGAGRDYGVRIAPSYIYVTRDYFVARDPRLKSAKAHVDARDWAGAMEIWEAMTKDPEPKLRAKAWYNIALAHEVEGRLSEAQGAIKKAVVEWSTGRTRNYLTTIEIRLSEERRLKEQLKVPPKPEPKVVVPVDDGGVKRPEEPAPKERPEEPAPKERPQDDGPKKRPDPK